MEWIAERFVRIGDQWLDAATGQPVHVHVAHIATSDERAWADECARLARLRHPRLRPLVDYGPASDGMYFEAFDGAETPPRHEAGADRLQDHLHRFLAANGISMHRARAADWLRAAGESAARPLGLTLQRRRAFDAIEDALDGHAPSGPVVVHVAGARGAGLRTLRLLVARAARVRGFVAVCAATACRYAGLQPAILERHVCLLDDLTAQDRSASQVSRLIAGLGAASARRHVIVRFARAADGGPRAIRLEPLEPAALAAMVFRSGDISDEEIVRAAEQADGLPGLFVASLGGLTTHGAMVAHETASRYAIDPPPRSVPVIGGRLLGAARGAPERARTLTERGRHAAAARLLSRASRVLEGRERPVEAAACLTALGWLRLQRGATTLARQVFDRAGGLADAGSAPGLSIEARVGTGVALTDECRSLEAEAVLRGALAAAETLGDVGHATDAAAALARCLVWQGRHEEALATATPWRDAGAAGAPRARLLCVISRAYGHTGRAALAVRAAREAQQTAPRDDAGAQASAELAVALALGNAGDVEGARAAIARALRIAGSRHLPLARVRAALVGHRLRAPIGHPRLAHRHRRAALPALLAQRLEAALAPSPPVVEPVSEFERFLDISQRAPDDRIAATRICDAAAGRAGAAAVAIFGRDEQLLTAHGRGWASLPGHARACLLPGAATPAFKTDEPREIVEAIRFGGDVIAVLCARWLAGAATDQALAALILRAAALSVAPHVRALLDRPPEAAVSWPDLLGDSEAAAVLRDAVARAARAPFPVLVEGESGCGKELVARAIHRLSPRRDRRCLAVNCAALTDDLLESELFGHVRGAFTGAAGERAGLFEEADGGTLFLDEVGELSARAQAKLLRVLQDGEIRRVGESFPRRVDVRVVAATNRRLEDEAAAGRFRSDLRFRLDVVRIVVPPLRDRAADIPLLATHFWRDASARVDSRATLSTEALGALARYDWPGNVRELQNVIAWMAVQSPRRGRIGPSALPRHLAQAASPAPCTFEAAREEFERRFVRAALAGANGQRARAAAALGMTRQGLSKMMRRLRIDAP